MKRLLETLAFCALLSWFYHWGHCNGRDELFEEIKQAIPVNPVPLQSIPEPQFKPSKVYRV